VNGGLADVSLDFVTLLRDYRQLQKRLSEKDHEADQRVASKANALHRVIGTLRLQAIRDPLTGLFNRRALDELLPRLIDHCRGAGEDMSLLMIDVDHFKPLNDNLGHAAGDEMLKSIAQLIRSGVRTAQDAGFRCGGDEFVIVMPGCPIGSARALADRLTALVANLAKTVRVTPKPGLSIGVCSINELPAPPTAASLLQEADRRLYEMKQKAHRADRVA
jgi:diguanylate cyclase (GGDEF)-like protein